MAAWNTKESDTRSSDEIFNFIVFCEDESSEISYLRQFETPSIKINLVPNQKSNFGNITRAILHCQRNGLFTTDAQGTEMIASDGPKVWCVYDRDRNHVVENPLDEIAFNESIIMAEAKGFKVAWSNDAFELWVLLHFEDLDPAIQANANRELYYQRLTHLFREIPSTDAKLLTMRANPDFSYRHLKGRIRFLTIVLPVIKNSVDNAIRRANVLEQHHNNAMPVRRNSEKAPCTKVHHLVNELRTLALVPK